MPFVRVLLISIVSHAIILFTLLNHSRDYRFDIQKVQEVKLWSASEFNKQFGVDERGSGLGPDRNAKPKVLQSNAKTPRSSNKKNTKTIKLNALWIVDDPRSYEEQRFDGSGILSKNVAHGLSADQVTSEKAAESGVELDGHRVGGGLAGQDNAWLTRLAQNLNENTRFDQIFVDRKIQGQARLSFDGNVAGEYREKSLKLRCAHRLLGAYLLKSAEDLLRIGAAPSPLPVNFWRPAMVIFDFKLGHDPKIPRVSPFKLSRGLIQIERYALLPLSVDLGPFDLGIKKGFPLSLIFKIEMESLISSKHRKRYGWSGSKISKQVESFDIVELDRRAQKYIDEGKLILEL